MLPAESHTSSTAGRHRSLIAMFFIIVSALVVADLLLKSWSFQNVAGVPVHVTPQNVHDAALIPPHDEVRLIPSVLSLKLTLNHGAVFGIGQGARILFIAVTGIAVIVVIMLFWNSPATQRLLHVGLAMVLGGALGNVYDRIFCGAVRDMLYLFPGVRLPFGLTWPGGLHELYPWIFNLADVALVIGVGCIIISLWRTPPREKKTTHTAS